MIIYNKLTEQYELNGVELTRCTQLVELIYPFDKENIRPEILEPAIEIGTKTHQAIEAYLTQGIECLDWDIIGRYEAFKDWYKTKQFTNIQCEKMVHNDYVAGTIDLLTDEAIIDFKTNSSIAPKKVALQLALYTVLIGGLMHNRDWLCLHLRKDGNWAEYNLNAYRDTALMIAHGLLESVEYRKTKATQHTITKEEKQYDFRRI